MIYKLSLIFFCFALQPAKAQQNNLPKSSGKVIYTSRITWGSLTVDSDTLQFNRKYSFFQWPRKVITKTMVTQKKGHTQIRTKNVPPADSIGHYNFYDTNKDTLISRTEVSGHKYLLKEKPALQWHITDSTKKVGKYTCTKATAHFRGRNYIAWFAPKIPLQYGPWKLMGLPGLILQAYDQKGKIYFIAKDISFNDMPSIRYMPHTGDEEIINLAEYKIIMTSREKKLTKSYKQSAIKGLRRSNGGKNTTVSVSVSISKPMELFGKEKNKE